MYYYTISKGEYDEYISEVVAHENKFSYDEFGHIIEKVFQEIYKEKKQANYTKEPIINLHDLINGLVNHGFIEIKPLYEAHIEYTLKGSGLSFDDMTRY